MKGIFLVWLFEMLIFFNLQAQNTIEADSLPFACPASKIPVGYGDFSALEIPGAVSHLESHEFIPSMAKNSPLELVNGKLNGLVISVPNGSDPNNDNIELQIRGINSIYFASDPLIIVDGVPANLYDIAPEDIESITLLRDVASCSIFGAMGAGTVILLKTRQAERGRLRINYSTHFATERFEKHAEVYNAGEFTTNVLNAMDYGDNTDWFGEITRNNLNQQHYLSVSGGGKHISVFVSVNYRNLKGVVKNSGKQDMKGYMNLNLKAFRDRLNIDFSGRGIKGKSHPVDYEIFKQALQYNPTMPVYDEEGNYTYEIGFQLANPVNILQEESLDREYTTVYGKASAAFKILKNLTLNGNVFTGKSDFSVITRYTDQYEYNFLYGFGNLADLSIGASRDLYYDFYASYSPRFNDHQLYFTAGYNHKKFSGFGLNSFTRIYSTQDTVNSFSFYGTEVKKSTYFGRLNYTYDEKYIVSASFSMDRHTYFPDMHQLMPSVALSWRLSREHFMHSLRFVNELKIRGSYGIIYSLFSRETYASNPNPDLQPEKLSEINLGIDWSLFQNRISGSVDVYKKTTDDVILPVGVPSPPFLYPNLHVNMGKLENRGVELIIHGIPVQSEHFKWVSSILFMENKNMFTQSPNSVFDFEIGYFEMGYTGDPIQRPTHRIESGEPLGNFYGYKSVDLDESGRWIIENTSGERIPISRATNDDMQLIGNGMPEKFLGLNNSFNYKDIDLSISLRGAFGFQVLNMQRMFYEPPVRSKNMLATAHDPVFGGDLTYSPEYVSYYIEDGDYLKIDNVTLGYTKHVKKILSSFRFYVSAQHLYTFTNYNGIDPEVSINPMTPGIEPVEVYPKTVVFLIGAVLHL